MTTLTYSQVLPMDLQVLDEHMDMAASPFHQVQVEDLDLEFDQMENPKTLPLSDNPMDDASDLGSIVDEAMQGDDVELFDDENLQDDNHDGTLPVEKDFDMGEEAQDNPDQDDEILYDDDEDDTAIADTTTQLAPTTPEQDLPEEDLFDFDDTDHADRSLDGQQARPTEIIQEDEDLEQPWPAENTYVDVADLLTEETSSSNAPQQTSSENAQQVQELAGLPQEPPDGPAQNDQEDEIPEGHTKEQRSPEALDDSNQVHNVVIQGADLLTEETHAEPEAASSLDISSLAPHFVTLKYNEVEYPLFSDQETVGEQPFPLTDTSLLFEPLDKLLEACRDRIYNSGEDHLDEIMFSVPVFGLHYCQDSKYTAQRSLADILQVYVMLKQNERADFIRPLNCTLAIRTCLATQYDWLLEEARKQTPYQYFHTTYIANNTASVEEGAQPLEEHTASAHSTDGEAASLQQDDVVHSELDAEATRVPSGEALESRNDEHNQIINNLQQDADSQPLAGATHDIGADEGKPTEQPDTEPVADSIIEPAGEHGEQTSEFFEDAFENEAEIDEVEDAEEILEQTENQHAFDDVQEQLDNNEGFHDYYPAEEDQLDFGDEPEPFEHVEEEKEIALEDEDLFVDPEDPLEANEDPDALLEGRATDSATDAGASHSISQPSPVNGNHSTSVPISAAQPITPGKARPSKRKADEDEDDFLDLEFDTPEPKRRRPSPS